MKGFYLKLKKLETDPVKKELMRVYDEADEIKDKRYDLAYKKNEIIDASENKDLIKSRKGELYDRLDIVKKNETMINTLDGAILANITAGNIFLGLSKCYLDVFEYTKAKESAQKGRESLWRAYQKQPFINVKGSNDEINRLLVHLNLAKYYREWAALTRRSNYLIAVKELDIVIDKLVDMAQNDIGYDEIRNRQLALIYIDAVINKGRIQRLNYELDKSQKYLIDAALLLLSVDLKVSSDRTGELKKLVNGMKTVSEHMKEFACPKLSRYLTYLNRSDWKDYFLSALTQISLVMIKQRKYEEAMEFLEAVLNYDKDNRDAKNNLAVCYRKRKKPMEAIDIFLEVVTPKNGEEAELKSFLEQNRMVKNSKNWQTVVNRFAYINLLKCVLDLYEADRIEYEMFVHAKEILENHLERNQNDYEVRLLNCRYLIEEGKLDAATASLEHMLHAEELSYIRRGTIGLKVRYQLAKCYMKKTHFNKAEKLLISIRNEIYKDGTGKQENQLDPLVENNIGKCLQRQGRYENARICYENMIDSVYDVCGGDNTADTGNRSVIDKLKVICGNSMQKFFDREKEETELSREDKKVILEWENSSRIKIAYLNNIGECYLRIDGMKKEAKKIFDFLIRIKPDNGLAKLYRGYCEDEIGRMEDYFNEAFQYASDEIEIRSGYLIHKVDLYLNGIKKEECSNAIENFIFYNPYPYTLNMCLAVLHWVKDKYEDFPGINDFGSLKEQEENFYMHFSRIEFYNELGTRAFEKLRNEPGFHHLKSVERGMIMAYLIYLYEPIIKIRKKCHFQYENLQELRKTSGCGLVHYSKLDTLKALLDQTGTPHLRVSNSGYMNDSSEGETFFEKLEQVSDAQNFDFKKLIECYFHERQENPNNVLPRGGNVYITSLSTQADSFPMWNIYAEEERGCNIEFDEDFFDLKGDSWGVFRNDSKNEKLDYSISTYTDDDYPLYKIQYENCSESSADFFAERRKEIAARWNDVEKIVQKLVEKYRQEDIMEKEIVEKAADEIRAFVADRINEVRYLFKDKEYSFEGEVRLVRVVDINDSGTHTDGREIPRAFTEVDKEIKDIIVTLGSKISDEEVNEIATWLKHTGRVNGVRIAMRNRPRQPVYKSITSS